MDWFTFVTGVTMVTSISLSNLGLNGHFKKEMILSILSSLKCFLSFRNRASIAKGVPLVFRKYLKQNKQYKTVIVSWYSVKVPFWDIGQTSLLWKKKVSKYHAVSFESVFNCLLECKNHKYYFKIDIGTFCCDLSHALIMSWYSST